MKQRIKDYAVTLALFGVAIAAISLPTWLIK